MMKDDICRKDFDALMGLYQSVENLGGLSSILKLFMFDVSREKLLEMNPNMKGIVETYNPNSEPKTIIERKVGDIDLQQIQTYLKNCMKVVGRDKFVEKFKTDGDNFNEEGINYLVATTFEIENLVRIPLNDRSYFKNILTSALDSAYNLLSQ